MIEDYPEEEMYLKEHESLDRRISESELERSANSFNSDKSEESKE